MPSRNVPGPSMTPLLWRLNSSSGKTVCIVPPTGKLSSSRASTFIPPVVTVRGLISEMKRHSGPEIWNFSVVVSCAPVNLATSSSPSRQEASWAVDSPVVPVVSCPHAGNANTKRKVRAANIVRKYGTGFPLLIIYHTTPLTIAYRCKQCNVLGKRDVAASLAAATRIQIFDNTPPTAHLGE